MYFYTDMSNQHEYACAVGKQLAAKCDITKCKF